MIEIEIEHKLQNLYAAIEDIREVNEFAWFFLLNTFNVYFSGVEIKKELDDYLSSKMEGVKKKKMTIEEMNIKSDVIIDAVRNDNTAQGDYLMPELIAIKQLFDDLYTEYNKLLDKWSSFEEYGGF